jgi:hypothetical protein
MSLGSIDSRPSRAGLETAPATTFVVVIGASHFPKSPNLPAPASFKQSANAFVEYLLDPKGFGLPKNEHLLNLFDSDDAPSEICIQVKHHLSRVAATINDVLFYYVGHGVIVQQDELCLAVRNTSADIVAPTSLRMRDLADAFKAALRNHRIYVILDCCFSASASSEWQSAPLDATVAITERSFPGRGVALLCSTSATGVGIAPPDDQFTLFSGALLTVLKSGDKSWPERLSLELIGIETRQLIERLDRDQIALPEVHAPVQREGSIADVGLFPNPSKQKTGLPARIVSLETGLAIAQTQIELLTKQLRILQDVVQKLPASHRITEFTTRLVLSADGSAVVERECIGITATQSMPYVEIPYNMALSQGTMHTVSLEMLAGSAAEAKAEVIQAKSPPNQTCAVIRIHGPFTERSGFFGFRLTHKISGGFLPTKEEVEHAYAKSAWVAEVFGSSITVPVDILRVTVVFPPDFEDSARAAQPVVFFGETEVVNEEELRRLDREGEFNISGRSTMFIVRAPRRGNQYAITWMPPPRSPVASTTNTIV